MLLGKRALLIGSLGLGGYHNLPATAWWAAESWDPEAAFEPTTSGMLDYGSFYSPKTAASADGQRRIVFAWLTERWCDMGDECASLLPTSQPNSETLTHSCES